MFAIVDIQGQQFKVTKGDILTVKKLHEEEGKKITFDKVYLLNDGEKVEVGTPFVKATVEAKILQHSKGEKIRIFKKKPKKRYERTMGHRDHLSKIEIENIKKGATLEETSKEAAKAVPKAKAEHKPKAATKTRTESKPKIASKLPKVTPKTKAVPKIKKTQTKSKKSEDLKE